MSREISFNPGWPLLLLLITCFAGCSRSNTPEAEDRVPTAQGPAQPIDPAQVSEITGRVSFEGQPPERIRVAMSTVPACTEANQGPVLREDIVVNDNKAFQNVFVYVKDGLGNRTFPPPTDPVILDQEGCRFRPHVLGVMTGQNLEIKNNDPLSHNVHPVPRVNRAWNEAMAPGAADLFRNFGRPEVMIEVRCNLHPWMRAYIGIVSNPFFAVTGQKGEFTLKGLPPGDYIIEAWQEKLGTQDQKVTVGLKETKVVQFIFKG